MVRLIGISYLILLSLILISPCCAQEAGSLWEPIVIKVIHLEHADAEHLASVLKPLLSKDGRITAYAPTNTLIIRDRASRVDKLVRVIKGNVDTQ